MIITAPVTDYIPASILTTQGDMVVRGAANPGRMASAAMWQILRSRGVGVTPNWAFLEGAANSYLKTQGLGTSHAVSPLALRDTGVFIGDTMRNTGGDQVITGIGFESSVIIFFAGDAAGGVHNQSWGFDNGTQHACIYSAENGTLFARTASHSISIWNAVGNRIRGLVSAIGADGFTITWTLDGARSASFIYLCLP